MAMLVGCALAKIVSYALGSSLQVQWLPTISVQGSSSSVFAVVLGLIIDLIILMLVLKLAVEALVDTFLRAALLLPAIRRGSHTLLC